MTSSFLYQIIGHDIIVILSNHCAWRHNYSFKTLCMTSSLLFQNTVHDVIITLSKHCAWRHNYSFKTLCMTSSLLVQNTVHDVIITLSKHCAWRHHYSFKTLLVTSSHTDYRERLTLPILEMVSSGDEFFLCDDNHNWWNGIPDPKYLM